MHSQQLSSTAQAKTLLRAFSTGKRNVLTSELERTVRVHCESADQAEQERWELLAEIAGQLQRRSTAIAVPPTDVCWSLLRHLAGTKAPRTAVATA